MENRSNAEIVVEISMMVQVVRGVVTKHSSDDTVYRGRERRGTKSEYISDE